MLSPATPLLNRFSELKYALPLACLAGVVLGGAGCRPAGDDDAHPGTTLTTAADVRKLSSAEAARGYPVHIKGVVTSYGNERYVYYVQDPTGGVRVDPMIGRGH